jgi:hypothetical protein
VADRPALTRLSLSATSVADDLGFVALADLSSVLHDVPGKYRIIGGHMLTALVARWGLGATLYRETGDTDMGASPVVLREIELIDRLAALGYEKIAGDRFARPVNDLPVHLAGDRETTYRAVIDVLIPAYTSRARHNRRVGPSLVTTEVPGLATALRRPPVTLQLALRRLDGSTLMGTLSFPDEVSALVLKGFAITVRHKDTDVVDLWRCLEVCWAAGAAPQDFAKGEPAEAAAVIRRLFGGRRSPGMATLVGAQRLAPAVADQRVTRVRALVTRVLGPGVA